MAALNEQIGINQAAYFPTVTLSASGFAPNSTLSIVVHRPDNR